MLFCLFHCCMHFCIEGLRSIVRIAGVGGSTGHLGRCGSRGSLRRRRRDRWVGGASSELRAYFRAYGSVKLFLGHTLPGRDTEVAQDVGVVSAVCFRDEPGWAACGMWSVCESRHKVECLLVDLCECFHTGFFRVSPAPCRRVQGGGMRAVHGLHQYRQS